MPFFEQSNIYNSINFQIHITNSLADPDFITAWYTAINVLQCPSDGNNPGGFRNDGYNGDPQFGQYAVNPAPIPLNGGAVKVPVSNYLASFGDNYCIGPLTSPGGPWETPVTTWPPVAGQQRIGWPGYQGTNSDIGGNLGPTMGAPGMLRGMFDYATMQTVTMASITDGTSNTVTVGESIPAQRADNNVWTFSGVTNGMTVPINQYSGGAFVTFGGTNWSQRGAYSNTGFKSLHPGGGNFAFGDGSVHFLKASINMFTYCALGSRNGGEVISSDSY